MVEGAGANKESGVRVRGNLLPVRNFELHKKKADLFVDPMFLLGLFGIIF